uniref:Uncharacterized protein n=1 Tax=Yersinia ruckeri TaxID=29486 RepID=A0A0A8VDY9_YERRU|nr:hypothetical protein CSF007_1995 [Yersinia ruckeri]
MIFNSFLVKITLKYLLEPIVLLPIFPPKIILVQTRKLN